MIVWDIEGETYPPQISYVGDPRHLSPEVQGVVDQFFARFTTAGLRCGMTLRPQQLGFSSTGQPYQANSDDANVVFKTLDDKIQYAVNRWGCTLFYIDSNGDTNWPIDPSIFSKLADKHRNVLLIPENKILRYYAYTAPYCDLKNQDCESPQARCAYPHAFSVISFNDIDLVPGDAKWSDLVRRVQDGDVLMFQAWWNAPHNAVVSEIYRKALALRNRQSK